MSNSATPSTAACQSSLSFTISLSLLKLMSIESLMPSNHLNLCRLLLLLPSIFSSIWVFSMSQLFASSGQSIGASASASVLPVIIQGWFPFRIDWFDLRFSFLCSFIFVFREHMLPPPNTAILKLLWSYCYLLTTTPVWTTISLERLSLESGQRRNLKKDSFIHSFNKYQFKAYYVQGCLDVGI